MIRVNNVTKEYGSKCTITKALDNVSLEIKKNEIVAIVGKSGSGKSTLLNVMSTMDSITSGEIFFDDNRIDNISQKKASRLRLERFGFVFQKYYLMSTINVFDNICLPLVLDKKNIDLIGIDRIMEKLGIKDLAEKMPFQLSGGEQQRVAIARALINNPEVIFADEPTGNLDSKNGEIVIKMLVECARNEAKTVVFVTHDNELANLADRKIILRDGVIYE